MELEIVKFLNHLWNWTFFDKIMEFISWKHFMLVFFVILIWILIRKNKKQRKKIFISFVVAIWLFFLISELFFKDFLVDQIWIRPRPYISSTEIKPIWTQYSDSSFPSSHMTSTLAVLTVLVIFRTWSWSFALAFALLMALSRMHNGMHYPSDVLAWSVIWILCWILWTITWKKIEKIKIFSK